MTHSHSDLRRIGLLNDFVRVGHANGSSFASQFLYRELEARGREVTVVGPRDPEAAPHELPQRHLLLESMPLRMHPGVHLAMPTFGGLRRVARARFDLVLGQTSNALMDVGVWLRAAHGVPLVMVNTVHLPSVYNALLSERLDRIDAVHAAFAEHLVPFAERQTVDAYNRGDGLVVLSPGLKRYWRERGVRVPVHVIGRAVEPKIFDAVPGADPFLTLSNASDTFRSKVRSRGSRCLVVCRLVREKGIARLLRIFARRIAPARPEATLALVGDGPDRESFESLARQLGIADRRCFAGAKPLHEMPTWYAHADLFLYTSLSETYGQVVTEALWCGLPVVAFADGMGVSGQIEDGVDGALIEPGPDVPWGHSPQTPHGAPLRHVDADQADHGFGSAALRLLANRDRRSRWAQMARTNARRRADPQACVRRYLETFEVARRHRLSGDTSPSLSRELGLLGRWAGVHTLAATLGLMRKPDRTVSIPDAATWALDGAEQAA